MTIFTRILLSLDKFERAYWQRQFKLLRDLGTVKRLWPNTEGDQP